MSRPFILHFIEETLENISVHERDITFYTDPALKGRATFERKIPACKCHANYKVQEGDDI